MSRELGESRREVLLWLLRLRRRFRVTGASMIPALQPGDEVLVDYGAYRQRPPTPGEIVVARHPVQSDVRTVKRVTAVFSDGRVFLQGDNPAESTDSRVYGAIPPENILGKVTSKFG